MLTSKMNREIITANCIKVLYCKDFLGFQNFMATYLYYILITSDIPDSAVKQLPQQPLATTYYFPSLNVQA